MKMYVELSHDEVVKKIPYAVICEGRYGKDWDTGRRKRLWKEQFTEEEQPFAEALISERCRPRQLYTKALDFLRVSI